MENYGRFSKSGFHQRVDEFLDVLDGICEDVEKGDVDVVFFSGDAFKNREPSTTLTVEFAKRIRRIVSNGVYVFLLVGNHDVGANDVKANTLDIYGMLDEELVVVGREVGSKVVKLKNGESLRVCMYPWSKEGYMDVDLGAYGLECDATVVMLHGTVSGAVFGAERSVAFGTDKVLDVDEFIKGVDYVALGHLHPFQVLREKPPVIYSGSPVRIDFSEDVEEKGYIIGEIKGGVCDWKFVESRACKFLTIKLDLDEENRADFAKFDVKGKIVRVVLRGESEVLAEVVEKDVYDSLSEAKYVVGVVREVTDVKKKTRVDVDVGIDPESMVDKFLEYKGYEVDGVAELAKKIIREDGNRD
jgi:exonuclease SbcD